MKKTIPFLFFAAFSLLIGLNSCSKIDVEKRPFMIPENSISMAIETITVDHPNASAIMVERGVKQVARLWQESDGTAVQFVQFCTGNYCAQPKEREAMLLRLDHYFEILWGNMLKLQVELNEPIHLEGDAITPLDLQFAAFNPQAHLGEDLFANKIAFVVILNYPEFSLIEKNSEGGNWNRFQWATARMGDQFTQRIPAALLQEKSKASIESDAYISDYNIFMGYLLGKDGKTHFPQDMKLISHWNLRDELKSNYDIEGGVEKQEMIYAVMKKIVYQTIPQEVINASSYEWDVFNNKLFLDNQEVIFTPEPDIRYQHLLTNFHAIKALDAYYPSYPTYIERRFSEQMEIPQEEVEKIFINLCSSEEVRKLGKIIEERLGRELRPYDIWYNGFKPQTSLSEVQLDAITTTQYPTPEAFEDGLDEMLLRLGFSSERASFIASKIRVDGARGAGHAWGAAMKSEKARLRTRIGKGGMNYKGYNIAVHEFGHNVEQTISLHDVDYYIMNGVPNTAFTEALAFIFQKRDLDLLGVAEENAEKERNIVLSALWNCYEIMGVSLVDMGVWKWMYANPNATPKELKVAVIKIAREVWNSYFADVFGVEDSPILAIYSHMIDNPLYLSAYPIGHLVEFQIDRTLTEDNFATEVERIYAAGRLTPKYWMLHAVGEELSAQPLLDASAEAITSLQQDKSR